MSSSRPSPWLAAAALALAVAGCAPTLHFNQSFLVAEELRLSEKGYASLKSTGETFDLGPLRKLEARVDKVVVLKVHGTWFVAGEGFKNLWRMWPGGDDEVHYKPVDLEPGPGGFGSPALEPAGKCALFSWGKGGATEKRWITTGGDADAKGCPDA